MLLVNRIEFESWTPNLQSSGQKNPQWTRMLCNGVELMNAVDWIDWQKRPTQLLICDSCGVLQCAPGGYARVSRQGRCLVFTRPHALLKNGAPDPEFRHAPILEDYGALLIRIEDWNSARLQGPSLPDAESFPRMNRADLAELWASSMLVRERPPDASQVLEILKEFLLCTDDGDAKDGIQAATRFLSWVAEDPHSEVQGEFVTPVEAGRPVICLYLDGNPVREWPALVSGGHEALALTRELAFASLKELPGAET